MKGSRPLGRALSGLFLLALLLPAGAVADGSHQRIVAFGDSLVDSGNVFVLTGRLAHKPYLPVPDAPYPIGGPQFSNGPTWVEQLAKKLGAEPSTGPSLRANGVFTNYAFGGARAGAGGNSPSLSAQVGMFFADFGCSTPPNTLFAIAIGGNDLRAVFEAEDPTEVPDIVAGLINGLTDNLIALVNCGATDFVVANLPNLAAVPVFLGLPEPQRMAVSEFVNARNLEVEAVLAEIDDIPGVNVAIVDGFTLSTEIANPARARELGFKAGTEPCLKFGVEEDAICNDRDAHFYWDGIHPTRAGHALIAERALEAVTAD
ncbi:MAG: SGNH/GDSL hydrolase family protein [Halofilum sp. (in: g-proteobacteria)]|nr:SGNH/GDSL hydrolase family protein [Halofilum sp. (in: g-proteobacteria)]